VSVYRIRKKLVPALGLLGLTAIVASAAQPYIVQPKYKVRIERAVMIPMRDGK
jgi:hypothetical protein